MSAPQLSAPTAARPATNTLARALDEAGFTRAQFWVLMIILAGMFFDTLEQNSVGAMGSLIKSSLHIGNDELTAINSFTVIGGLIGRFAGGWIADRHGRRTSLSVNLLVYTLGGLLSAVAMNYPTLLASRLVVGSAWAASSPSASRCCARWSPPATAARSSPSSTSAPAA
jgi:putative MFS transporter